MSISKHASPLRFQRVEPKNCKYVIPDINEISLSHIISFQSRPQAPKMPEKPLDFDSFCIENSISLRNEKQNLILNSEPGKSRDFSLNIHKNDHLNIKTYTPKHASKILSNLPFPANKKSGFLRKQAETLSKKLNLAIKPTNISVEHNNTLFLRPMKTELSIISRKKSVSNPGLLRFLILNDNTNVLIKLKMIFQNLFLSHFLAIIVTICKAVAQNRVNNYCWISLCFCQDDIKIKIFSTLSDFLFFWTLYLILCAKSIVVAKEFTKLHWLKGLIYFVVGSFILVYYLLLYFGFFHFNLRSLPIFY